MIKLKKNHFVFEQPTDHIDETKCQGRKMLKSNITLIIWTFKDKGHLRLEESAAFRIQLKDPVTNEELLFILKSPTDP